MNKITCQAGARTSFDPIFICGLERTGTTLLLSLACTTQSSNPLSAECDYITALLQPYLTGRNRFDLHTNCYYSSLDDFENYHAKILRNVLTDMWASMDCPEKLVLKDPRMTRYANIILKLLPECKVICMIRDPRDVVASRVSIEMRRLKTQDPNCVSSEFINQRCREYNFAYEYILTLDADTLQRVMLMSYEYLVQGNLIPELEKFMGVNGINTDVLWKRSIKMGERKTLGEWITPLYGQQISSQSVGRYQEILSKDNIDLIDASCSATYEKLLQIGQVNERS